MKKNKFSAAEKKELTGLLAQLVALQLYHPNLILQMARITGHLCDDHGYTVQRATKTVTGMLTTTLRTMADALDRQTTDHQRQMLIQAGLVEGTARDYPKVKIPVLDEKGQA